MKQIKRKFLFVYYFLCNLYSCTRPGLATHFDFVFKTGGGGGGGGEVAGKQKKMVSIYFGVFLHIDQKLDMLIPGDETSRLYKLVSPHFKKY